jgi:hypothetical protein
MPRADNVLLDLLNAWWARDIRLKRMNWPTQQSFFCKIILDAAKKRVCSHVNSFAVCLRSDYPFSLKSRSSENWSALSPWPAAPFQRLFPTANRQNSCIIFVQPNSL